MNFYCNQCGKPVPPGSKYCCHCGARLPEMAVDGKSAETQADEEVPVQEVDDDDYELEPESEHHSFFNGRTVLAALITLVILALIALYLFRTQVDSFLNITTIGAALETVNADVPMNNAEAFDLFKRTLDRENRLGTMLTPIMATEIDPLPDGSLQLAGLAACSQSSGNSYFTIYHLVFGEKGWCVGSERRFTVGASILTFTPELVVGDTDEAYPRQVNIDSKRYLYFLYMTKPHVIDGTFATAKVSLCLYNLDTSDLVTLDYEGELLTDATTGVEMVKAIATNDRQTPEAKFLSSKAESLPCLKRLTAEEMEMEKPENAVMRWTADNAQALANMTSDQNEINVRIALYSMPIFSSQQILPNSQVENSHFVVVVTTDGSVMAYSKANRGYFVIYAPTNGDLAKSASMPEDDQIFFTTQKQVYSFSATNKTLTRF